MEEEMAFTEAAKGYRLGSGSFFDYLPTIGAIATASNMARPLYSLYKKAKEFLPEAPVVAIPGTNWKFGLVQDNALQQNGIAHIALGALTAYAAYKTLQKVLSSTDSQRPLVREPQHIIINIHNHGSTPVAKVEASVPPTVCKVNFLLFMVIIVI